MLRKVVFVLVIIGALASLVGYGILNYSYSDGVRSGRLVKVSQKGFFLKTYEGTLDLGSGDRLTWDFSVYDDEVGEQLIAQSGKTIRLEYTEHIWKVFYNTKYNVTKWSMVHGADEDKNLFCRLVNILRKNGNIVNAVKPLIKKYDNNLMSDIRGCQN